MLQQAQSAGNALRIALAQEFNRLLQFSAQDQAPSQQSLDYRKGKPSSAAQWPAQWLQFESSAGRGVP